MKRNWRQVAEEMRARELSYIEEWAIDRDFLKACRALDESNPGPLAEYLRSDRPLGKMERDLLGRLLWQLVQPGKAKGRPRSEKMMLAFYALDFYRGLRQRNKRLGIKDHGHGNSMKDFAARTAVTVSHKVRGIPAKIDEAFIEAVRAEMDRPKSRLVFTAKT